MATSEKSLRPKVMRWGYSVDISVECNVDAAAPNGADVESVVVSDAEGCEFQVRRQYRVRARDNAWLARFRVSPEAARAMAADLVRVADKLDPPREEKPTRSVLKVESPSVEELHGSHGDDFDPAAKPVKPEVFTFGTDSLSDADRRKVEALADRIRNASAEFVGVGKNDTTPITECGQCWFWKRFPNTSAESQFASGTCRRNAPSGTRGWRPTDRNDFCGEGVKKTEES